MNKIIILAWLCCITYVNYASSDQDYRAQVDQLDLLSYAQKLDPIFDHDNFEKLYHDVDQNIQQDRAFINAEQLLDETISQLQSRKNQYDLNQDIQNFLHDPSLYYYQHQHIMPQSVAQAAFKVIRAQSALQKNSNSAYWIDMLQQEKKALMHAVMLSQQYDYLYSKDFALLINQLNQQYKNKFNRHAELQKVAIRHPYLLQVFNVLELKKQQMLVYNTAARKIQSCMKSRLYQQRLYRNIDDIAKELLSSLVVHNAQQIASEQMLLAQECMQNIGYQKLLDDMSQDIVIQVMHDACVELESECETEKIERDKQKAKLKKLRYKENKKKNRLQEREEELFLEEQIQQNQHNIDQKEQSLDALLRDEYYQKISVSSLTQEEKEIAILAYDIRNIKLFNHHGGILNKESIPDFLVLFEKLLTIPMSKDLSLWKDVLISLDRLDQELRKEHEFLYYYVINKDKFAQLLWSKEKEGYEIKREILASFSPDAYEQYKILYDQIQRKIMVILQILLKTDLDASKKIELNVKVHALREQSDRILSDMQAYEKNRDLLIIINKIKTLHHENAPFSLFYNQLPCVHNIGNLSIDDWKDIDLMIAQEYEYWLRYEEVLNFTDLVQSLMQPLKKISLPEQCFNKYLGMLARGTFKRCSLEIQNKVFEDTEQKYFEHLCKINYIEKHGLDDNVLADLVKLHEIFSKYYLLYLQNRAS